MFDLNANDGSVRKKAFPNPIPDDADPEEGAAPAHELDSQKNEEIFKRLMSWYLTEVDRQRENRLEMATDEDFYDSIQWTEEEKQALAERNQMALVYNVISTTINWIIGTEKQARTDFKILPRRKNEDKPAERKTALFKYLADVNSDEFEQSRAFEDAIKCGVGWMEDGLQDGNFEEPLYARYESWRNILHDSSSTALDMSDARYIHRAKWVDADIAKALFPGREQIITESVNDADAVYRSDNYGDEAMDQQEWSLDQASHSGAGHPSEHFYQRDRVRLIETWFRLPVKTERMKGGPFAGEIYDAASPGHQWAVENKFGSIAEKVTMRVFVAIYTNKGLVWLSESPFRHNQFPFTPIWCNRRGRDGQPYGVIRGLRGIQADINKRASKALHILSTNKVVMEKGAVDDLDDFAEEVAKPDAIIVKNPGKELELNADRDIAQWHVELMSRSIQMIQSVSGVTDELMGRQTNAASGIAVERRQSQGILANAKPFDNLRYAKQRRGEKILSNIEQFISEEKAFRITNMRGNPEYVTVNDGLPENDITRSKADFVISEADWNASVRQAAANELLDAIKIMAPEVAMAILDLVVENMDLPNRDEVVRRIRAITGQRDPDQQEPSPEEQQRAAAQQQMQALQQQSIMLDLKDKEAKAMLNMAKAQETQARTVGLGVDAQGKAMTAGIDALTAPAAATVADKILHESGFVSRSEKEEALAQVAQAAAAQQAQQQAQQQAAPPPQPQQPEPMGLGQQGP